MCKINAQIYKPMSGKLLKIGENQTGYYNFMITVQNNFNLELVSGVISIYYEPPFV